MSNNWGNVKASGYSEFVHLLLCSPQLPELPSSKQNFFASAIQYSATAFGSTPVRNLNRYEQNFSNNLATKIYVACGSTSIVPLRYWLQVSGKLHASSVERDEV